MQHPESSATVGAGVTSTKHRPLRWWAMLAGSATVLALLFAAQHYLSLRAQGRAAPLHVLIAMHLARWYLWVALSPIILAVARRWPIGRSHRVRHTVIQLVAAAGVALAHALASTASSLLIGPSIAPRARAFTDHVLALFAVDLVIAAVIAALAHAVEYHRHSRLRERHARQIEARLAQMELEMLRMQLEPHFLFNALNTVSSLMHRDVDAADAMLAALGDLLRLALRGGGAQEVPLRQEMEFLRRYLDVMRLRFGTRLSTVVHVDPAALDALVPNLMLQPLVENAVRHGIAARHEGREGDGGCVEIRAERVNGSLRLRVADDGPGLPEGWDERRDAGVGLSNTRARLSRLYGAAQRLELANRPTGGVELTVVVPFRAARTPPRAA